MDLAIKDVRRHLGRFAATIAGVGLLVGIVLIMNGIYEGNISDGVWLIDHTGADLWIVERNRGGPFNEQSRIPGDTYRSITAVPGVAQASPFIAYTVERTVDGRSQQFTIIGYDVFGGLGGPVQVSVGRPIGQAHYEMIADAKLGLKLGDRVHLGNHDYTVVGLTRGAVDSGGNPLVYLSVPDAQEVLYQQDNEAILASRTAALQKLRNAGYTPEQAERMLPLLAISTDTISAVLVRLAAGADSGAVAHHIERWLYLNVYTTPEERELMLKGRLRKMTAILGLFRSLLVLVSLVIIALIIYVLTIEKIKSIATLKLMGATHWVIIRLILEQSLVLTLASFALGYTLVHVAADKFPRTLVFLTGETLATFAIMLVGGVIASGLAIWHALRTPPSIALGG